MLFGSEHYTNKVDVWSAGCVFAEMFLRRPIFAASDSIGQIVEIVNILGTPTREDLYHLNPSYVNLEFPSIQAEPWNRVLGENTPPGAMHLLSGMLQLRPSARLNMSYACAHHFHDELRRPGARLPNGGKLPPLFDLTPQELESCPDAAPMLAPLHRRQPRMPQASGKDSDAPPPTAGSGCDQLDQSSQQS